MRLRHFEELAPICPRCRAEGRGDSPLRLALVEERRGGVVIQGALHCAEQACRQEFPILDGIPVILPDVARWLSDNLWHVMGRDDLSPTLEGMIGDAAGPGSAFETTRYHLSSYTHDHWGEFDPAEPAQPDAAKAPGAVARCLAAGLDLLGGAPPEGLMLDIGCAVGRSSLALAQRGGSGLVLGVDLNLSLMRLAQRVLATGRVSYPRRRIGLVYDRREFAVPAEAAERVDIWACDAQALPFPAHRFGLVSALNVLDCVGAPHALLAGIAAVLRPGGGAVLATPYDWSGAATPPPAWIGGHSQRGPLQGAAEPLLRALLTPGAHPLSVPGLRILGEIEDFPWHVRLHERSTVAYLTHLLALRAEAPTAA